MRKVIVSIQLRLDFLILFRCLNLYWDYYLCYHNLLFSSLLFSSKNISIAVCKWSHNKYYLPWRTFEIVHWKHDEMWYRQLRIWFENTVVLLLLIWGNVQLLDLNYSLLIDNKLRLLLSQYFFDVSILDFTFPSFVIVKLL